MENNCKRYNRGSCIDGDHVDKCVGKDCGAYEPKSFQNGNSSESELRISVEHLREILEEMADGFDEPVIYDTKVEDIIERVKKEI